MTAQGPYEPTWTNRRRVVFAWQAYFFACFPAVVFLAPEHSAEIALWILGTIEGLLLTYYLIGPSYEYVKAWVGWRAGK